MAEVELDCIDTDEAVRSSAFCELDSSWVSSAAEPERRFMESGVGETSEASDCPELVRLNGRMPATPEPVGKGEVGARSYVCSLPSTGVGRPGSLVDTL